MNLKNPPIIPNDFKEISDRGPFSILTGPFYRKVSVEKNYADTFGFLPQDHHMNRLGFLHGGMVSTILDLFMAQAINEKFKRRLVTTRLSTDFIKTIPANYWIEVNVKVSEINARNVDAEAHLISQGHLRAIGKATFKLFRR